MIKNKKNKFASVKFWLTLWCMVLLTYIIHFNRTDFITIAQILCTVPLTYIGCNVWQKKIFADKENQIESEV